MEIIDKDILTVETGIIVHQVNCQGVMGSGLAKQIKKKWPDVYIKYRGNCAKGPIELLGTVLVVEVTKDLSVANLFGQEAFGHDRRYTNYDALRKGLEALREFSQQIYIPYGIGCGLGGGNWNTVKDIIEKTLPEAIICKLN